MTIFFIGFLAATGRTAMLASRRAMSRPLDHARVKKFVSADGDPVFLKIQEKNRSVVVAPERRYYRKLYLEVLSPSEPPHPDRVDCPAPWDAPRNKSTTDKICFLYRTYKRAITTEATRHSRSRPGFIVGYASSSQRRARSPSGAFL